MCEDGGVSFCVYVCVFGGGVDFVNLGVSMDMYTDGNP